jgi:hypothetical protein
MSNNLAIRIISCVAVFGAALACGWAQETATPATSSAPAATGPVSFAKWRTVTTTVSDRKAGTNRTYTVRVGELDYAIPLDPVSPELTSFDTPLTAWVGIFSIIHFGKTDDDLKLYASHFRNPDALRKLAPGGAAAFFEKLRTSAYNPVIVGLMQYDQYTVVVYNYSRTASGATNQTAGLTLVRKVEAWAEDFEAAEANPLLRDQSQRNYPLVKPAPAAKPPTE